MIKIYGVPISVHTRKVIVVALAKGLEYEVVPVVPVIPDSLPADWRRISPTGLIPALTDGEFTLNDSAAICAYLDRKQPEHSVYPRPAREYAQALSLEQYAGALFHNVVHPLFHQTVVNPKMRNLASDQSKVDQVLATAVPDMFAYLDSIIVNEFLVGTTMSIADIAVASNLTTYQYLGFDLGARRFPRLQAHYERVVRQPALRDALQREKPMVASMGLRSDFLDAMNA